MPLVNTTDRPVAAPSAEEVPTRVIRVLELDRPDARNAMSTALLGQLLDAVTDAREDDGVAAIVLTGAAVFGVVLAATGGRGLQRAPRAAVL